MNNLKKWFGEDAPKEEPREKVEIDPEDKKESVVKIKANGEEYYNLSPKEAFGIAIQPMMPHLKYMSPNAVGYYVDEINDMMREDMGMRVTPLIRHFLSNIKKTKQENVIVSVYNLLLSLENLAVNQKSYGA